MKFYLNVSLSSLFLFLEVIFLHQIIIYNFNWNWTLSPVP